MIIIIIITSMKINVIYAGGLNKAENIHLAMLDINYLTVLSSLFRLYLLKVLQTRKKKDRVLLRNMLSLHIYSNIGI